MSAPCTCGRLPCPAREGGGPWTRWSALPTHRPVAAEVETSRRRHTHLSIIGQFLGPASSTFTQVAFGDCLEPPGNSANQVRLVPCPGRLAEQLGIPLAKLPDAHRP